MKVRTILFAYLFISIFLVQSCVKTSENSVFYLPENYRGHVLVIFEVEDGEEPIYENGNRIYKIPSSGILETKFKKNIGISTMPKFFYKDSHLELKYAHSATKDLIDTSEVVVGNMMFGKDHRSFLMFTVGKRNQQFSEDIYKFQRNYFKNRSL